jgi:cytochrome c oxidase subunit 3
MAEDSLPIQFVAPAQRNEAVTLAMWVLLATEALMFGALFLSYLIYRLLFSQTFAAASAQLDSLLAALNTGVLLTSSLTIALAIQAVALRRRALALWLLAATVALGCLFLILKGYAWYTEYQHHLVPLRGFQADYSALGEGAQMFFNLYFVMTGMHALHLSIGIAVVLVMMAYVAWSDRTAMVARRVGLAGLYWHFVDIIWVFLFPLFYLVK